MRKSESAGTGDNQPDPQYEELAERLFLDPVREGRESHTALVASEQQNRASDNFKEIFDTELAGWCYGLANYPGDMFDALAHRVISELKVLLVGALTNGYVFDMRAVVEELCKATKFLISEKEITFSILAQFPDPRELSEEAQYTMAMIIDQADQQYGDVVEKLNRKWLRARKKTTLIGKADKFQAAKSLDSNLHISSDCDSSPQAA